MRVRFTLEALGHIAGIQFYIESRSAVAARRIVARIRADSVQLSRFPRMGHHGLVPGTLEWKVGDLPYIIVYEIRPEEIGILGIYHAAQTRGPTRPTH